MKNIDDNVSDEELQDHFSSCGSITSAKVMREDKGISKGFGSVRFSTLEEANEAVNTFHGLYVALAQKREDIQAQLQLQHAQQIARLVGHNCYHLDLSQSENHKFHHYRFSKYLKKKE